MQTTGICARRFQALWRRRVDSPPSPEGALVFAELRSLYGSPGRHFHTLDHIGDCVCHVDEVRSLLADADAVELGLWFHDAVYEQGAATNERRSAQMFLERSKGARPAFRRRVAGMILATLHGDTVQGHDRRFVVDIDLAGFGASWDEFMRKGALIRAESPDQTDAEFYAKQVPFLQRLQQRPFIFATDYFRDRYEARAQGNLRRLLDLRESQVEALAANFRYASPSL